MSFELYKELVNKCNNRKLNILEAFIGDGSCFEAQIKNTIRADGTGCFCTRTVIDTLDGVKEALEKRYGFKFEVGWFAKDMVEVTFDINRTRGDNI